MNFGEGVEEPAAIGGAAQGKHEPWELAREISRGNWGGAKPVLADGAEADVVGEGGEACGDGLDELRWEVRPIDGGEVVGHDLRGGEKFCGPISLEWTCYRLAALKKFLIGLFSSKFYFLENALKSFILFYFILILKKLLFFSLPFNKKSYFIC